MYCPKPFSLSSINCLDVVKDAFSKQLIELKLKGFGFRGEVVGRMVFANLDVQTDLDDSGEEYVIDVLFEGKALQSDRTYQIATADMFTFGRLLPGIANVPVNTLFLTEFISELLVQIRMKWRES